MDCVSTGIEFLEFISAIALAAADATSYSELGVYFLLAQNELVGDRAAMTATIYLCEGAYPRFYQSTISALGDWIDACAQVDDYSSTWTDERCMDLTNSASAKMESMNGRIDEASDWLASLS
tara:strand:+ start:139 stop:504 length:366 start_codon:yes stop_codon:yes gene_type:complete